MTEKKLFMEIAPLHTKPFAKATIVGVGQVGMAIAYSVMIQNVVSEIALVDIDDNKLQGEKMDMQHGQSFNQNVTIKASTDYAITKDSAICIVTAGFRQAEGESRLDLVHKNVVIFKKIIPNLVKYSPQTVLLIVTNPVDVLTWVAWKLSGLPRNRVLGSGTMLDSSRFRFEISRKFGISPTSCHAYIVGEHGDSSVPMWSCAAIGGTRLREVAPKCGLVGDPENWAQMHLDVVNSAYEVIKLKGYTCWAIGMMMCTLCKAILRNEHRVYTLTTNVKGLYDITEDTFMSVPCTVGENGITHILIQQPDKAERAQLLASAKSLLAIQKSVVLSP